ncbi:hemagglutinin protein [Streptococcus sp. DD11]|uniref:hypothetical protein n=1 Tax=Streptococcus sp. DD11 TaxID=1777879 RepID=UPI0007950F34|nr:hypothetical protein [Streptococcus sp. DD11]KXT85002.1 hemagglutinin protein [Streptococcus sp. DD11]
MKNKNEKEKKSFLSNLNERDKMLLTVVGGAAVLAGGGFLVSNSYTKMAQLSEEHATITAELDGKNAKISQKKSLAKQLSALNSETLEQAKKYYGTTNQGEFIFLVDKLVKDSGIKFKSVSYTESEELELQPEGVSATSSNGQSSNSSGTTSSSSSSETSSSSGTSSSSSETSSSSSSSSSTSSSSSDANTATTTAASTATTGSAPYSNTNITQMTADIEFEGTYTQVLKLLELIDGNQQKIVSSELELGEKTSWSNTEENKNPEMATGKIKLRFYQVKDVERYVTLESNVDKTPIEFANWESPFAIPTWQAPFLTLKTAGSGTDATGSNSTLGAATTNTTSNADSNTNLAPSYLEQLSNLSSQNNGLSAYYNSSTIYRFESPLKLVQSGSSNQYDVTVDNTDFLEGTGSNVVKIPATKSSTLFEMEFAAPYVSLNSQPDYISYSLYLSNKWQGETGLIVKNASGQKIYLHVIRPNSWTGWREVSFNPADIPGFSYPMTIMGYYFETPSGDSPETTMKLDNLAVDNLVVN